MRVGLALAAAAGLWLLHAAPGLRAQMLTGTAYGARIACTCHYVGGRALADCARDFEGGMALISVRADDAAKSVTARAGHLLMPQTAIWRAATGCQLEPWRD